MNVKFPLDDQIGCKKLKQFYSKLDKKILEMYTNKNIKFQYDPIIKDPKTNMHEKIMKKKIQSQYWNAKIDYDSGTDKIITPVFLRDPDHKEKNPGIKEIPKKIIPKNADHLAELIPWGSTVRLIIQCNKFVVYEVPNKKERHKLYFTIKMIECTPRKKNPLLNYSFCDSDSSTD